MLDHTTQHFRTFKQQNGYAFLNPAFPTPHTYPSDTCTAETGENQNHIDNNNLIVMKRTCENHPPFHKTPLTCSKLILYRQVTGDRSYFPYSL